VQPEVLLADEPVSMLDVSIRLDILNLLLRLKGDGLALLFITHDIASARYFAEDTMSCTPVRWSRVAQATK